MLSLIIEADIIRETRVLIREHRMVLAWRQEDLAKRSGLSIATVRRFERTGQIGFKGLARLVATLGLADRFLQALQPPAPAPKDIDEFLAAAPVSVRQRAPRREKT